MSTKAIEADLIQAILSKEPSPDFEQYSPEDSDLVYCQKGIQNLARAQDITRNHELKVYLDLGICLQPYWDLKDTIANITLATNLTGYQQKTAKKVYDLMQGYQAHVFKLKEIDITCINMATQKRLQNARETIDQAVADALKILEEPKEEEEVWSATYALDSTGERYIEQTSLHLELSGNPDAPSETSSRTRSMMPTPPPCDGEAIPYVMLDSRYFPGHIPGIHPLDQPTETIATPVIQPELIQERHTSHALLLTAPWESPASPDVINLEATVPELPYRERSTTPDGRLPPMQPLWEDKEVPVHDLRRYQQHPDQSIFIYHQGTGQVYTGPPAAPYETLDTNWADFRYPRHQYTLEFQKQMNQRGVASRNHMKHCQHRHHPYRRNSQ